MKLMTVMFSLLLLPIILSGCVTTNQPTTPPSVTISSTTTKEVMDALARRAVMKGATVISTNDYSMTVAKDGGSSLYASMFASRYSSNTEARLQYTVAQSGADVLLGGRAFMVTNPNSPFEKLTDVTRGQYSAVLSVLTEVKNEIMYSYLSKDPTIQSLGHPAVRPSH
jgi:hypothetical protein